MSLGRRKASPFRFPQLLKTTVLIHRLVRKARGELKKPFQGEGGESTRGSERKQQCRMVSCWKSLWAAKGPTATFAKDSQKRT